MLCRSWLLALHLSRRPTPLPTTPSLAVSYGSGSTVDFIATHREKDGHVEDYCYKKKKKEKAHSRRGGRSSQGSDRSTAGPSSSSLAGSETQEILMLLRRLASSVPAGAASSVTPVSAPLVSAAASQSSTGEPPFTLGTLPWILDSGASFHMTSNCTSLSSIRPSSTPITVQTADGSTLPVLGHGTLLSSSFHVPTVSYVPNLTMQLISAGKLTDHGCRVIFDSDSCHVQISARVSWLVLALAAVILGVFGNLITFVFLPRLASLVGSASLIGLLHLLLGGIIDWDIYVVLVIHSCPSWSFGECF
ncbi:unnamed protein product [Miscanthus lutarioriparius]|uniref:Retrovirus-related Pol polyprotein from transposon TNT 1-94-like beta-barrel domain-containing protein n=1 Tax=Miscanthus lutarioriparius TaxID=422564 RepID=A0A811MA05_9POAL|nr:unnamed protein product [Miscanthus lutarioriparius]